MKKPKFFIFTALAVIMTAVSWSATAAENYFRPGTVWTVTVYNDAIPADYIVYNTILDEITFEGEKVLPFAYYSDENPEPKIERYLRTDGDKVYWRSTNPESPEWYLLYDFGLKVGDEVVVYCMHNKNVEPATLKCVRYDFYLNDNPLYGPLMRLQTLKYLDSDYSTNPELCQGNWIIGMGYKGGPGSILNPHYWGWIGGGEGILCVESPKGNVVYGEPVAGIKAVSDSESSQPAIKGVYNMQGIRVADTTENLPAGLYIVNGKKTVIN